MISVDQVRLDAALLAWHEAHGLGVAIDGKTIRGAIDDDETPPRAVGIVDHDSKATPAPGSVGVRTAAAESERRANKVGAVIASFETLPDIADHAIAADALPTRRPQADRLPERGADHPFTRQGQQDRHARRHQAPVRRGHPVPRRT